MKKQLQKPFCLFPVILILIVLFWHGKGFCLSPEKIFHWVAQNLGIEVEITSQLPMPAIYYVDKEKLHAAFSQGNQNAFRLWKAKYGVAQAKMIMGVYLEQIVGLYNPDTRTIFVGNFLDSCRQQAVLAHEMTHYFQYQIKSSIVQSKGLDTYFSDELIAKREAEAYKIEKRFMRLLCEVDN